MKIANHYTKCVNKNLKIYRHEQWLSMLNAEDFNRAIRLWHNLFNADPPKSYNNECQNKQPAQSTLRVK
jgi:hypothetical protein